MKLFCQGFYILKTYRSKNKMSSHLNWLSWIQQTDYDAWLTLLKYLEPVINMRASLPNIRRDPWFHKMLQKQFKSLLIQELEIENMKPLSLYYNRYINHEPDITNVRVDNIKQKCNLHGIIYEPSIAYDSWGMIHRAYDRERPGSEARCWKEHMYDTTKEDLIAAMKDTKDVVIKKSWKKGKLLKALMSY